MWIVLVILDSRAFQRRCAGVGLLVPRLDAAIYCSSGWTPGAVSPMTPIRKRAYQLSKDAREALYLANASREAQAGYVEPVYPGMGM